MVFGCFLQAELTTASQDSRENAKRTFYRRNYARAKGIISQVQGVTDAISWLTDSCAMATTGSDDIQKVSGAACRLHPLPPITF